MSLRQTALTEAPLDVDRLKSFSDNIYAFSMTLLIAGIHLPDIPREEVAARLLSTLSQEWRQFASYAISFLNIGSYWILHHNIYSYVLRLNKILLWLNILLLLTVTFLPLPTALMGKYGRDSATALLYGVTIAANYVSLCLVIQYLYGHPSLVRPEKHLPAVRSILCKIVLPLLLILIGAALSFVHSGWSFLFYMSAALVNIIPWQLIFREEGTS